MLSWTKKDMVDKYRKYGILSEKRNGRENSWRGGGSDDVGGGRGGGGVRKNSLELSDDGHGSGSFSSLGFLSS